MIKVQGNGHTISIIVTIYCVVYNIHTGQVHECKCSLTFHDLMINDYL